MDLLCLFGLLLALLIKQLPNLLVIQNVDTLKFIYRDVLVLVEVFIGLF